MQSYSQHDITWVNDKTKVLGAKECRSTLSSCIQPESWFPPRLTLLSFSSLPGNNQWYISDVNYSMCMWMVRSILLLTSTCGRSYVNLGIFRLFHTPGQNKSHLFPIISVPCWLSPWQPATNNWVACNGLTDNNIKFVILCKMIHEGIFFF